MGGNFVSLPFFDLLSTGLGDNCFAEDSAPEVSYEILFLRLSMPAVILNINEYHLQHFFISVWSREVLFFKGQSY